MLPNKIEKLTSEQKALLKVYREKWRAIALSTNPINRQQATETIKQTYALLKFQEPEVVFFESPHSALCSLEPLLGSKMGGELGREMRSKLHSEVYNKLRTQLKRELENELYKQLYNPLYNQLMSQLYILLMSELYSQFNHKLVGQFYSFLRIQFDDNCVVSELSNCHGSWVDFCISALNLECDYDKWAVFQSLAKDCGWIYPFDQICFVCDRPVKLSFDEQQRLHAEGEPAVQFADGFSIYAYHGVRLPVAYGKHHPHTWQAKWLLSENNAEVRRILIQGIGYGRLCQELQAVELNSWKEYTLLKIDKNVDIEPIYLLKMTCPSTGYIHTLRVPPTVTSAKAAIRWVNWGVDPEEFSEQT
ncbi:MAG: DUF6745 domain-containing protein [Actinomycetota bacterium]